jgi:hypothetical protein
MIITKVKQEAFNHLRIHSLNLLIKRIRINKTNKIELLSVMNVGHMIKNI